MRNSCAQSKSRSSVSVSGAFSVDVEGPPACLLSAASAASSLVDLVSKGSSEAPRGSADVARGGSWLSPASADSPRRWASNEGNAPGRMLPSIGGENAVLDWRTALGGLVGGGEEGSAGTSAGSSVGSSTSE